MKLLSDKAKKTIKQLLKEFSLPFAIATAWTIYVHWNTSISIKTVGTNFGPAFFFVSWMTGQIFRVRKQAGMENSLAAVEERIQNVTKKLEHHTEQLLGYMSGGSSYCCIMQGLQGDNMTQWFLQNWGVFPMYAIEIRVVDLQAFRNDTTKRDFEKTYKVDELKAGHLREICNHNLGSGTSCDFNVFITARNGNFVQHIRYRHLKGYWQVATRLKSDDKTLYENVPSDFDDKSPW